GDYNDPMTMLELYLSYAPSNPGYNNPEYDRLIESSKHIVNPEQRMKVLHDAEKILMYDMPIIPIHYRANALMVSKQLKDYKLDPLAKYRFHYSYLEK
ncbi:peptide ABC transporter substrate-binding protein, partial [Brachyspira hampsonii]|nr:peptide ABC transporter substrate-binding protein [Brachyspira hampsonii]MBW5393718.1 peptide ABC transporter substrate-binding protein [Brachyspira hampsonii]